MLIVNQLGFSFLDAKTQYSILKQDDAMASQRLSAPRGKKGWQCSLNVFTSLQALFPCLCQIVYWAQLINVSADKKIGTVYIGSQCWRANFPVNSAPCTQISLVRKESLRKQWHWKSYKFLGLSNTVAGDFLPMPSIETQKMCTLFCSGLLRRNRDFQPPLCFTGTKLSVSVVFFLHPATAVFTFFIKPYGFLISPVPLTK